MHTDDDHARLEPVRLTPSWGGWLALAALLIVTGVVLRFLAAVTS